jgi:hypothetical protein
MTSVELEEPGTPTMTYARCAAALKQLGTVIEGDPEGKSLSGRVVYGLQRVHVQIVVSGDERGSRAVVSALSDDAFQAGAKNALERFARTLEHVDDPDFRPDRRGTSTLALVGGIALFVGIFCGLVLLAGGFRALFG